MKRIAFVGLIALPALALGGCFHEAALDRHLYDGMNNGLHGTNVAALTPTPAPVIASSAQPAPPMRDPNAPDASLPAPLGADNSATTGTAPPAAQAPSATGAPPLKPATPASPS